MEEQTHYYWINPHGSIPFGSPLILDETGKLNPPWSDERPNNIYPINNEVLQSNNSFIEIQLWNQTDMCTVAFRDLSLLHNFDTSKFKKYLSIHAQGSDIKLVNVYKDGVEYTAFQGSSINGPTAPVYNVPNIFFSNEPSPDDIATNRILYDRNIKKLNYDGTNYTIDDTIDGEIFDTYEEGKNLYLHANTFSNTDRSSLIEKICNSIDYSNTNSKHKIIIFNSSCLSVNEDYISAFFALYPEWSEIFGDNYLLGIEKHADWEKRRIKFTEEDIVNTNKDMKLFKESINTEKKIIEDIEKKNKKIDKNIENLNKNIKMLNTFISEIDTEIQKWKPKEDILEKYNQEKSKYTTLLEKTKNKNELLKKKKEEYEKDKKGTEKNIKEFTEALKNTEKDKEKNTKYYESLLTRKTKTKKHLKTEKARKSLGKPKLYIDRTRSQSKKRTKFKTYKQKSGKKSNKKSNKKFKKFGGKKYKTKKKPRMKKK